MRRIEFKGERLDELLGYASSLYGNVVNEIVLINDRKIGFFVHEKYYFRTGQPQTCSIHFHQNGPATCEVDIVATGGYYKEIPGVDWGARSHFESTVAKSIIRYAVDSLKLEKTGDRTLLDKRYKHKKSEQRRGFPRDPGDMVKLARE